VELVPFIQAGLKKFSGSICIFLGWEEGHKKIFQMFKQALVPIFVIVLAEDKLKMEEKIFQDMNATAHIKVLESDQIQEELGVP
jgi:drug/metabolite transporter superfamily protein YnfA